MAKETNSDGVFDPSNLHLKKELIQIQKAARVLRDPGTLSTCRSPLNSARSLTKIHYMGLQKNGLVDGNGNGISSSSEQFTQLPFNVDIGYSNENVREKEKRVVLHNWRSSSDEESSLIRDESEDVDVLSDVQDCDSDKFTDISFSKQSVRKKSRSKYASTSWKNHKQMILSKRRKSVRDGCSSDIRLEGRSSNSLVGESNDVGNYYDSENLRRESAVSPFLGGVRNKNLSHSPRKGRSSYKEDDSDSYSATLSKKDQNKYLIRNPSTVESLGSFNEAGDEVDVDLLVHQGCGIPCYWSKKLKPRLAYDSCYSSSVSDTLRKRQLSGSKITYQRRTRDSVLNGELSTRELGLTTRDKLHEEESTGSVTLSQKYRPVFFHEVIGQSMVIQSLTSAVSHGRIFPFYLFHGPRGTGKTSTAKIFAAALNCLATEVTKPCGVCMECSKFISGKSKYLVEVDGSNKKVTYEIKNLSNLSNRHPAGSSKYKVIVVDDCHLLPSKAWLIYLRLLEKPLPWVIFVFVATDIKNLPHTVLSRCQDQIFDSISIHDIVTKLRKIAGDENLDVESDALELIASNADGSIQDAESMLDQLRLFGKRISGTMVTELTGVVSDDTLLELLELAMSSNASETVKRTRELLNTGVDPIALISQTVTVIVDIIAETYPGVNPRRNRAPFGGKNLSENEKDRLNHALMLLSEAAKHLRVSSEGSTWFTAILLQLGSMPSPNHVQISKATKEEHTSRPHESSVPCNPISTGSQVPEIKDGNGDSSPYQSYSNILLNIWHLCVEKCQSKTLRLLLQSYGKLVSVSETKEGGFVAQIGFRDNTIKTTVEGFLSSIANSFEIVLQRNVEVKIILLPDSSISGQIQIEQNVSTNIENRLMHLNISGDGSEYGEGTSKLSKRSLNVSKSCLSEKSDSVCGNANSSSPVMDEIPENRIDSLESMNSVDMFSPHWEDELNRVRKGWKGKDGTALQDSIKRNGHHHASSSLGYESGPGSGAGGWTGLLCWKSTKTQRKGKGTKGNHVRARTRRPTWFGECAKFRRMENRYSI